MKNANIATIAQIHERLLRMAKAVVAVLEKYKIPYSLAYGTLLGAVRHKGFIPWDDDFDLWLFDDTYEIAIEYLRAEFPDDMFVEDSKTEPKYFHAWAHVKDLNTVVSGHRMHPHDTSYACKGLSLDLYRLWKMKECDLQNFLNEENRRYIMRRRKLSLMSDEEYKERLQRLAEDDEKCAANPCTSDKEVYAFLNMYKTKNAC